MKNSITLDASFKSLTMGQKIKKLRKDKGWSRSYLAKLVNLSPSGLYRIENDECQHTRKIVTFSRLFNIDPHELDNHDEGTFNFSKESYEKFEMLKKVFPDWKEIIPLHAINIH